MPIIMMRARRFVICFRGHQMAMNLQEGSPNKGDFYQVVKEGVFVGAAAAAGAPASDATDGFEPSRIMAIIKLSSRVEATMTMTTPFQLGGAAWHANISAD